MKRDSTACDFLLTMAVMHRAIKRGVAAVFDPKKHIFDPSTPGEFGGAEKNIVIHFVEQLLHKAGKPRWMAQTSHPFRAWIVPRIESGLIPCHLPGSRNRHVALLLLQEPLSGLAC
ncbi:hypothetical protein KX928_03180 [Roseobacter sp. YSTF-M11]|uniref:Uncharacterized protein n=1 Tax=Roseobacter insulae TaxID=2859783 RepID=A0A9X1JZ25_9RHOB|nr:hypothetical protein [Roseobacter insulae]MBW4706784.1 hypothetical protein [Roseobacter insulae]